MKSAPRNAVFFFGGLCLLFSAVEFALPKPLPFLRYGIANLPIIVALDFFSAAQIVQLAVLKCILAAAMSGTLFSYVFIFSAFSALSSAAAMLFCRRIFGKKAISVFGISFAGALASAASQIFAASKVLSIKTEFIAPPFLTSAFASSFFLAAFAMSFAQNSEWLALAKAGKMRFDIAPCKEKKQECEKLKVAAKSAAALFLFAALCFSKKTSVVATAFAASILLAAFSKAKINFLMSAATFASIVAFNSIVPSGREVLRIFSFSLTDGALLLGIRKACAFEGAIFASKFLLKGVKISAPAVSIPFAVFEGLCGGESFKKSEISPKGAIRKIDERLLRLCRKNDGAENSF